MSLPPPPVDRPGFNLNANQHPRLEASSIVLIVLPTLFVVLRLASRKVARAGYWWDDLLIVITLVLSLGLTIANLVSPHYGFGRHIWALPPEDAEYFLKILFAFEILFYLTICFTKLSIIAFYRRIFPIAQLRVILWITTATVVSFTIASVLVIILQCIPVHTFWAIQDRQAAGARCLDTDTFLLVSGGINCVLDFFIVMIVSLAILKIYFVKNSSLTFTSRFRCCGDSGRPIPRNSFLRRFSLLRDCK